MRARLTIEAGEAWPGVFDLAPDQAASLGRSRDNTVVLRDEHASRLHAKIAFENGRWQLRDLGLNGTRIDGQRVDKVAELDHGQEIRIGEVRLRFTLEGSNTPPPRPGTTTRSTSLTTTSLLAGDDTPSLLAYTAAALEAGDPHRLAKHTLQLLISRCGATVAGFLSPDPADPLPRTVLPDTTALDLTFARHLNRRAQRDGRTFWLGTEVSVPLPDDETRLFTDALCVPVPSAGSTPAGMLHLYKAGAFFKDRDVRFCESVAPVMGKVLAGLLAKRRFDAESARVTGRALDSDDLVGDGPVMVKLRDEVARIAAQPGPVLIEGELGTGKHLVARVLHRGSGRSAGPFVAAATASVAPALLEAELFGRRKDAATPGTAGLCELADEGTLYIDELADLSPDTQSRLLHLIEERRYRPIGATADLRADVRVVAGTRLNFDDLVGRGQVRPELAKLLSVLRVRVPPLREHRVDLPYLVQCFLDRVEVQARRTVALTPAAMQRLRAYDWPGNVRQLWAELEVAVQRTRGEVIDAADVLAGVAG